MLSRLVSFLARLENTWTFCAHPCNIYTTPKGILVSRGGALPQSDSDSGFDVVDATCRKGTEVDSCDTSFGEGCWCKVATLFLWFFFATGIVVTDSKTSREGGWLTGRRGWDFNDCGNAEEGEKVIGESHSVGDDRDAEDELVIEDLFAASTNCVAKRLGFNEMKVFLWTKFSTSAGCLWVRGHAFLSGHWR